MSALVSLIVYAQVLVLHCYQAKSVGSPTVTIVMPESPLMNLAWKRKFPEISFATYPYMSPQFDEIYRIPINKGDEAMTYLTYIIQFYEMLPDKILFIHGHYEGWHQVLNIDDIIALINWKGVESYTNLRSCTYHPASQKRRYWSDVFDFSDILQYDSFLRFWNEFGMSTKFGFPPLNSSVVVESYCCSQFLVDRTSVKQLSREFYIDLRAWLINTDMATYYAGRVFEYLWHIIFTGKLQHLTSKAACDKILDMKKMKDLTPSTPNFVVSTMTEVTTSQSSEQSNNRNSTKRKSSSKTRKKRSRRKRLASLDLTETEL